MLMVMHIDLVKINMNMRGWEMKITDELEFDALTSHCYVYSTWVAMPGTTCCDRLIVVFEILGDIHMWNKL
jgi:hypothetical protein